MVRGGLSATLFATLFVASACYAPDIPSCAYSCTGGTACPDGYACVSDRCIAPGTSCTTGPDARPDGTSATCGNGTAEPGELCLGEPRSVDLAFSQPRDAQFLDLDGDMRRDLVVASGSELRWALAPSAGAFTGSMDADEDLAPSTTQVATLESLTGGAVFTAGFGSVQRFDHDAVLKFTYATASMAVSAEPIDIEVLRFDGVPHLAVLWPSALIIWPIGPAGFQPAAFSSINTGALDATSMAVVPATSGRGQGIAFLDRDVLRWHEVGTSGSPGPLTPLELGFVGTGLGVGDLDGDGHVDMVIADTSAAAPSYQIRYGTGVDPMSFTVSRSRAVPSLQQELVVTDMNGDGFADILYAGTRDEIPHLFVQPGGASRDVFGEPLAFVLPSMARDLHVSDVNSDGAPDIVVTLANDILRLLSDA